jgi:hypothetical protein
MNERSFLALLLVTAAAVGAAVFVTSGKSNAGITPDHGKVLLPGLLDKANVLAEISIDRGREKMEIRKAGGRFVDASGYPVKIAAVRDLVTSLGRMTIEEDKTSDPKRYAELTLAPPGEAKGGTAVALKTANGKALADVVLGARDYTVGAAEGGQYVRGPGSRQSYLVRGNAALPDSRLGWFDPVRASVPVGDVARLTLIVPGKPAISVARQNGKLTLVALPADRKPVDDKIAQLAEFFSPLSFAEVRKADATPIGGPVLAVETTKGLKLRLDEVPQKDPAKSGLVIISVQPTSKTAEIGRA